MVRLSRVSSNVETTEMFTQMGFDRRGDDSNVGKSPDVFSSFIPHIITNMNSNVYHETVVDRIWCFKNVILFSMKIECFGGGQDFFNFSFSTE